MLWKIIGGVFVVIPATSIGIYLAEKVKGQLQWLKEIKRILLLLHGELAYRKTPLPEAFQLIGEKYTGSMSRFLSKLGRALSEQQEGEFITCWKREARHWLEKAPMTKEQKAEFEEFGESFIQTDTQSRDNSIQFYISRLDTELEQLTRSAKDRIYLYRMLGLLGGVFLWILVL